jgi:GMP synthase-like glutamine amidotransferase
MRGEETASLRSPGMRALVVSHDPSEEPGLVGDRLHQRGWQLEVFVVCDSPEVAVSHRPFPALDGIDLVVAMGSPWSVYDTDRIGSWVTRELELVRDAHNRGIPFLGVCFGGQLLAAALGGTVERAPRPELGWVEVRSDDPDLIAPGPWFQWHGDRFVPPAGARVLAENDVGVQAFSVGRSLGVQFHPEADARLLRSWLEGELAGCEPADPIFAVVGTDPRTLVAEADAHAETAAANTRQLVDGFLDRSAAGRGGT